MWVRVRAMWIVLALSAALAGCGGGTGNPGGTTYGISGSVTIDGSGLPGVTVAAGGLSAVTDAEGRYTIAGFSVGTYTVTASRSGYEITPASLTVTVGPSATGRDFTATAVSPSIATPTAALSVVDGVPTVTGAATVTYGTEEELEVEFLITGPGGMEIALPSSVGDGNRYQATYAFESLTPGAYSLTIRAGVKGDPLRATELTLADAFLVPPGPPDEPLT